MEKKETLWIDEHSVARVFHLINEDVVSLNGFKHFGQQAIIGLTLITQPASAIN